MFNHSWKDGQVSLRKQGEREMRRWLLGDGGDVVVVGDIIGCPPEILRWPDSS